MQPPHFHDSIDVQAVCIGMFVHLDVGWMSHPFPLSSFKVTSHEQLQTLRSLGLKRVRWSPQHSDPAGFDAVPGLPSQAQASDFTVDRPSVSPDAAARALHRQRLAEQRSALALAERQFAEAARECRQLTDLVAARPAEARAQAEALTGALVGKMLAEDEVCIRLLTDAAGDKASVHALNVTLISLLMARAFGMPEPELADIGVGALLHDVGKMELPDRVRHLEESSTAAEARFYEDHVQLGVQQARRMGLSPGASLVVAQHHEMADGSGFPLRVGSDRMPAASRIVALVNRYDNLCNPQQPSKALTPHEALSMLFAHGKNKFDTAILGAFIKLMGVYPAGSAVQLTDDRYALVVAVNSSRPLKPRVMVHEPRVPRSEALMLDLEATPGLGIRRSLRPQLLPPEALEYLAPRPRVAYFFEPVRRTLQAA